MAGLFQYCSILLLSTSDRLVPSIFEHCWLCLCLWAIRGCLFPGAGFTSCVAERLKLSNSATFSNLKLTDDDAIEIAVAIDESANPTLTSLSLANNYVTDNGMTWLANCLKKDSCKLTSLDVSNNNISRSTGRAFLEALKVNCTLVKLRLDEDTCNSSDYARILEELAVRDCPPLFRLRYLGHLCFFFNCQTNKNDPEGKRKRLLEERLSQGVRVVSNLG
jgi:hypothetical protein